MSYYKATRSNFKLLRSSSAFTIIELLVVIAVIAALAAITVIAYVGITNQAHKVALSSGLSESVKALENYKTTNGITSSETYPTKLSDMTNLKLDNSINWTYYVPSTTDNTQNTSYCLQGTVNGITQSVSSTDSSVQTKPCLENGLVGWWKMNGNANDSSGLGNNGVIHGTTSATGPNNDGALYFNGTSSDYVGVPRNIQDNFSMSLWFKTSSTDGKGGAWYNGDGLLDCEVSGTANDFGVSIGAGSILFGTGNPDVTVGSPAVYNDGAWHSVVATRSEFDGTIHLYIDGHSEVVATHSNTGPLTSCDGFKIGSLHTSINYYTGYIDDVRVFNRVLSSSEILALQSAGTQ